MKLYMLFIKTHSTKPNVEWCIVAAHFNTGQTVILSAIKRVNYRQRTCHQSGYKVMWPVRVDELQKVIRSRAADECCYDDDGHLQRLDLGSRQRVWVRTVNANLVKLSWFFAPETLNSVDKNNDYVTNAQRTYTGYRMFYSRVGFSGTADLMALFSIRTNSRWRPPAAILG